MRTYQIQTAGLTDIGQSRAVNEDQLVSEGDLFAVADGMGGLGHGDTAARMTLERLQYAFDSQPTEAGLIKAVHQANKAVYEHSLTLTERPPEHGEKATMGSTLAAVAYVVEDGREQLVVVNVGDSRIYRLRNGQLQQLSVDHSKVAELVRAGTISSDQATAHPERHILTQALGVGPDIEPAVSSTEPSPGDRLLLCSDGLYNEIPNDELARILAGNESPDDVAALLIDLANERGGNDIITALVLEVS